MSFKGFKKAIVRTPQNFREKLHMGGDVTHDAVYEDAERRFKEIEIETKKLNDESKKYFKAISGMLDDQIEFSKAIEEIYKPISGKVSDPNAAVPEDNPAGIEAAEQYRGLVSALKDELKPDLDLIEKRVVEPAQELLKVIEGVRKLATKREHKRVDLDRHARSYTKLQEKKEKTAKDEEKMYKAESELEIAQASFDEYNDLLKNELPVLFQMQSDFIKPLFTSFYYMQLNIFYTLYSKTQEMKIPYFDLDGDLLDGYNAKKGDIEEQGWLCKVKSWKTSCRKGSNWFPWFSCFAKCWSVPIQLQLRLQSSLPIPAIHSTSSCLWPTCWFWSTDFHLWCCYFSTTTTCLCQHTTCHCP